MTALIADRKTRMKQGSLFAHPVAAAAIIYNGGLTCRNSAGFATAAANSANYKLLGVADEQINNAAGLDGAETISGKRTGAFLFAATGVTQANIGEPLYIVDDQTVGLGVVAQPSNITGVTLSRLADSRGGAAPLAFTAVGATLSWNGGTAVALTTDGTYILTGPTGDQVAATVVIASLPGSDQSDTITLRHVPCGVCESIESATAVWVDITTPR